MTDYPIIFSMPMVRAILGGVKTQTRRIAKLNAAGRVARKGKNWHPNDPEAILACPYGEVGGILWVRETWQGPLWDDDDPYPENGYSPKYCQYKADGGKTPCFEDAEGMIRERWRPSIHMPKWAARIHLKITRVRLERLQRISYEDAKSEGVEFWRNTETLKGLPPCSCHYYEFEDLWAHINGRRSWNFNPLVWVVDFEVVK